MQQRNESNLSRSSFLSRETRKRARTTDKSSYDLGVMIILLNILMKDIIWQALKVYGDGSKLTVFLKILAISLK